MAPVDRRVRVWSWMVRRQGAIASLSEADVIRLQARHTPSVAEHDPLRDDGARYAAPLRAAGVPVRFTEYVGMPHGYLNSPGSAGARRRPSRSYARSNGRRSSRPRPRCPARPADNGALTRRSTGG
jgi:acetyl esterase/lipase